MAQHGIFQQKDKQISRPAHKLLTQKMQLKFKLKFHYFFLIHFATVNF